MLIALRNQVYACRSPAEAPVLCWEHAGVRRVAEGISQHVVALDSGQLALLAGDSAELIATGLHEPIESLLILNDHPLDLLIGTEAPQLYRYRAGSDEVTMNRSFAQLDCRDSWHTPWGGPAALRSMASTADGWVYADIHVGSIMRSPDLGQNWEPVTPTLHEDVHQVATTPACNERVYANTYKAVYVSDDRGRSWSHRAVDLGERYGRAMAVHPQDPNCALASVSDGPHGRNVHGQLYHTVDAGQHWTPARGEWPESTQANIDTFHVTYSAEDTAWGIVDRSLFVSHDRGLTWSLFWRAPEPLQMLSCAPG